MRLIASVPCSSGSERSMTTTSGLQLRRQSHGLDPIRRLAHHLEIRRRAEERAQTLPDDRVIFD